MRVFEDTTEFNLNNTVVTLGKFDAIHLGHQSLLEKAREEKKINGCDTVVFSFDTSGRNGQKIIHTKNERISICKKFGMDYVIFYPVNSETMSMSPEEFVDKILINKLGAKSVVTGNDFCFGKHRKGNVDTLKTYEKKGSFNVIVSEDVIVSGEKVSTTRIKECLCKGDILRVNEMLGFPYSIEGDVLEGKQLGRTIGMKTVNIIPPDEKCMPLKGVYKSKVIVDGERFKSITNVGVNPTVKDDGKLVVETHIFDFDNEIYGKRVKVELEKFIREERNFPDLESLKRQISLDISEANL